MKKIRALGAVIGIILLYIHPGSLLAQETFRVMSWNVENLFDVRHDSLKNDQEFLPESIRRWHYGRYKKKLADISRVITAVGEWRPPALVALCEVENDRVLRDLTRYSPLREHGYRYVMTDSPDERGIDVALLYQRDRFRLLSHRSIRIEKQGQFRPTRDILHVSGLLITGDTLDVLVCHLPSRSGGAKASEPYRLLVAEKIRHEADSLMQARRRPQLILTGDFNDYPQNRSIRHVLGASAPPASPAPRNLYHLLARKAQNKEYGTYKYQGEWGLLDHLIVSGSLLNASAPFYTNEGEADMARLPFLLTKDEKYGGDQPFRTYYGMKYQGGYSDHLPVYVDFILSALYLSD